MNGSSSWAFEGEPLELIGGELIVAEPQGAHHSGALTKVDYAVRAVLPPGWIVRVQAPVSLDDESEPEPDLVVAPGRPGAYLDAHPARVTRPFRRSGCAYGRPAPRRTSPG
jgi:hypothetical protein